MHSEYFKKLNAMMACANAHVASGAKDHKNVCYKEMKELRLAAYQDELLYQKVNKRHFMNELMTKANQSPFWEILLALTFKRLVSFWRQF